MIFNSFMNNFGYFILTITLFYIVLSFSYINTFNLKLEVKFNRFKIKKIPIKNKPIILIIYIVWILLIPLFIENITANDLIALLFSVIFLLTILFQINKLDKLVLESYNRTEKLKQHKVKFRREVPLVMRENTLRKYYYLSLLVNIFIILILSADSNQLFDLKYFIFQQELLPMGILLLYDLIKFISIILSCTFIYKITEKLLINYNNNF